jgi:single-stranded DNA-binding protein
MSEDLKSRVEISAALVVAPEFEIRNGRSICRLTFPKKCSGQGADNEKAYWVQLVCFDGLADIVAKIPMGVQLVTLSRINANRWRDKDGNLKTSQNYLCYKVGVFKSMSEPVEWLKPERKIKNAASVVPAQASVSAFLGDDVRQAADLSGDNDAPDEDENPF